jgi:hypothetical protein
MPPLEIWGPAVWTLFHTIAERVNENAYPIIANQLFAQIVRICKVLPCPDCATDASNFLSKIKITDLKTKTEFKNMIYLFHNYVNAKKRKPLFNYANINVYANFALIPVLNNFNAKFNTKGNMNLITESFQRDLVQVEFKRWIIANLGAFIPPQQIPREPIAEPKVVEEPVQEIVVEEPVQEIVVEEPVQEIVVEEPVQEIVVEEPAQEIVEEPIQEIVVEEPVQEIVVEEPVQEIVVEEPVQEIVVEEPVQEIVVEEPVQEVVIEEPAQEGVEEPEVFKETIIQKEQVIQKSKKYKKSKK